VDAKKIVCEPDEVLWSPRMRPDDGIHWIGEGFLTILLTSRSILTSGANSWRLRWWQPKMETSAFGSDPPRMRPGEEWNLSGRVPPQRTLLAKIDSVRESLWKNIKKNHKDLK
jgi:hypothetical protein